jgi:hypothetical protein
MAETCTYRTLHEPTCPYTATHLAVGSGLAADWQAQPHPSMDIRPEFCEPHAKTVAEARNVAHQATRSRVQNAPRIAKSSRCAVCGERLAGVRYEVPSVGPCCGPCQAVAAGEQMADPRSGPKPSRRKKHVVKRGARDV